MDKNARVLAVSSLVVIIFGVSLLWTGLTPDAENKQILLPTPTINHLKVEATSSAVIGIEGEKVKIAKVVDGDTIETEGGKKVRFIGIDTPETVDPRRPVGCFGKEASSHSKQLLEGKEVVLQKDVSETDKFGRLLRYVYLPIKGSKLLFVNDYLVREGYAKASTYPPDVKFTSQFLEAEKWARDNKKGLWGVC